MKTQVNGITLAYGDEGKGTPVVFLHAFPLNRAMWEPQHALADRYRVIAVDLRGHGESDAPLWRCTLDLYAADVIALLDHLNIRQAVFVGLSMGGYLIFSLYRRYRDRVAGLVLADTRAEADTPDRKVWRFQLAQRVWTQGPQAVVEDMFPKLLAPATYQSQPSVAEKVRGMIMRAPVSGIVGDLMAIEDRPDAGAGLTSIACPTLVVVGEQDALTSVEENRRIAEAIPGAAFVRIPAAGHLSNMENPEAFNRALRSFLDGLGRKRG
jgi:3-oxoadipate enol-lactonase